jgi:endoglucanase
MAACFLAVAAFLPPVHGAEPSEQDNGQTDAFAQNQKIGRGVNILGYDPIWRSRSSARFQAKHFRLLDEAGFDSVRINLHPFRHMGPAPEYALPETWFETLDWAVENALANHLAVILDLHEFNSMGDDPKGNHPKFIEAWKQIAEHCKSTPGQVIFEILNEPSRELTPALWNQYFQEALAIIRRNNPNRTVIIGPPFWNSIGHIDDLELPDDDRNIIVTVHYYTPMEFTHQGAPWSSQKDRSGVEWLGTEEERKAIRDDFSKAADWAKKHNRPIFLGEFGAYDKAPMDSRTRYIDAVTRTAESFGWSWGYWQFDSDFILYDIDKDQWIEPIRDALIPSQSRAG